MSNRSFGDFPASLVGHPEADAFVRTINRDHGDATPPLVFADWLAENGYPEHERTVRTFAEGDPIHSTRLFALGIDPIVQVSPRMPNYRTQETAVEPHFESDEPSWIDDHHLVDGGTVWHAGEDDPVGLMVADGLHHPATDDPTETVPVRLSSLKWRSSFHPDEQVHATV